MKNPLQRLAAEKCVILPSMLLCDFAHLADECAALEAAGAPALHLDVMDGHFVDNMTYGLTLVSAFRKASKLPLDVHLMIANPAEYVEKYIDAGADCVTIHAETLADPRPVLDTIRRRGAWAGLAINPPTPVAQIEPVLDACDLVLVMSVMPGFGGQAFDPVAIDKLTYLKGLVGDRVTLEVDGGVNKDTIQDCAEAGASWFVAGSAIFKGESYSRSIARLNELAASRG